MPAVAITDGPPPCARDHQVVVLSCSYLARRWAALAHHSAWLVVHAKVKVGSERLVVKPTVLAGHLKHMDTMPFK